MSVHDVCVVVPVYNEALTVATTVLTREPALTRPDRPGGGEISLPSEAGSAVGSRVTQDQP